MRDVATLVLAKVAKLKLFERAASQVLVDGFNGTVLVVLGTTHFLKFTWRKHLWHIWVLLQSLETRLAENLIASVTLDWLNRHVSANFTFYLKILLAHNVRDLELNGSLGQRLDELVEIVRVCLHNFLFIY